MNKNIWIINEYAGSPKHGMEFRHYYLARQWKKSGANVTIISASYSHLYKNPPVVKSKYTIEDIDGITYVWIKVPQYGKSHDKRRIIKWFNFAVSLLFLPFGKMSRPDTIILSPIATTPVWPVLRIARKFKAKTVFEVRDIWPLSLVYLGGFSEKHPFIRLLAFFEKMALKKYDEIVSNLQNYGDYLKSKNIERKFTWISNGIDAGDIKSSEKLPEKIKKYFPGKKFIVGYAGTIGVANALESFLEAAVLLEKESGIVFAVVGEGQEKESLEKKYKGRKNILFVPSVSRNQVQALLKMFDACYIGLKKEPLFKFGVSPNKLFDYMYSGKPVIYAIDSGKNIVDLSGCGISVEAENPESISLGIKKIYSLPAGKRKLMGEKGRDHVMKTFTYESLAKKYLKII